MASIDDLATAASAVSALGAVAGAPPTSESPNPAPTDDNNRAEPPVARGALVVLEGLDRSGKTTQVKLLEQRFVELGRRVKVVRFPGGCAWLDIRLRLVWFLVLTFANSPD